jgi:hypothetical protein
MERCIQCRGQRYAVGLGGIRKKCHVCVGVGYVDLSKNLDDDEFINETADIDEEIEEMKAEEDHEEAVILPIKKVKKRGK